MFTNLLGSCNQTCKGAGLTMIVRIATLRQSVSVTSCSGLTGWSNRHPQAPLVGVLCASRCGAAYRER